MNIDHPPYDHWVEFLQNDIDNINVDELRSRLMRAIEGLELLLMAWARYEDEQSAHAVIAPNKPDGIGEQWHVTS